MPEKFHACGIAHETLKRSGQPCSESVRSKRIGCAHSRVRVALWGAIRWAEGHSSLSQDEADSLRSELRMLQEQISTLDVVRYFMDQPVSESNALPQETKDTLRLSEHTPEGVIAEHTMIVKRLLEIAQGLREKLGNIM